MVLFLKEPHKLDVFLIILSGVSAIKLYEILAFISARVNYKGLWDINFVSNRYGILYFLNAFITFILWYLNAFISTRY